MNRLLQGDVGSGKTVVAEYAMLLAVAHSHQAVLMAPTEVLAQQHFRTLSEDLQQSRVRIELLTGALTGSPRQQLLDRVQAGEVDLLIGTQAMMHEEIQLPQLGLVVIDEQHKFGVRQRAALKSTGSDPHYLVMTATPIPRTVAMSLFGDLDVSTLRQSPPGRQKVYTYLATEEQRDTWWEFVRRKLHEGRQGYVITPRVEESESDALASVEEVYERLTNGPLEAFRVDLIHGRLSSADKEAAMTAFRRGETQVLVGTSVIEVGVDVPNATLMTIECGERFGLAQLHQLRGRVRRGQFPGYVTVFAQPGNPAAQARLEAFVTFHRRLRTGGNRLLAARARRPVRSQPARYAAAADRRPATRSGDPARGPRGRPGDRLRGRSTVLPRRIRRTPHPGPAPLRKSTGPGRCGVRGGRREDDSAVGRWRPGARFAAEHCNISTFNTQH